MSTRAGARIASLAVLTVCCVLGLGPGLAAPAEAGSEHIASYRVDALIEADGTVQIREAIRYDFGGDRRHGIYRDIPYLQPVHPGQDREFPVTGIRVASPDGTPDQTAVSRGGGQLRIRIGSPDQTITGTHTYVITYQVRRALTLVRGHAQFSWNLVGDAWTVPISGITAQVRAPGRIISAACVAGPGGGRASCGGLTRSGSAATFRQASLAPGEGLTVQVGLPAGSVTVQRALIVQQAQVVTHWTPGAGLTPTWAGAGLGAVVLIAVAAWLLVPWLRPRWSRSLATGPAGTRATGTGPTATGPTATGPTATGPTATGPTQARAAGPDAPAPGLRPGQAGLILVGGPRPAHIVATLVNLAIRGYLRIEEAGADRDDWLLIRLDPDTAPHREPPRPSPRLLRYERTVLVRVFAGRDQVRVADLKETFPAVITRAGRQLARDAVRRGWMPPRRQPAAGAVLLVAGAALFLAGLVPGLPHGIAFFALAVMLAGAAVVLTAWRDRQRGTCTPEGLRLQAEMRSLRKKLRRFTPAADDPWPGLAGKLPYAIAFGLVKGWGDRFATVSHPVPEPGWWTGASSQPLWPYVSFNAFTTTMCSYAPPLPARHHPGQGGVYSGYGVGYGYGAGAGGGMDVGGGGGGGGGGSW